jgi:hypothetical protein
MANQKITVEIEGNHTFDLEPSGERDLVGEATAVFGATCVVERREDGSFTVHPVSRVIAVYVGDVPSKRIGFPTVPST